VEGIINLEDQPGKTVGRRTAPADSFKAGMDLQQTAVDLGKSLGQGLVPRGVYRFRSHQEADEWMMNMISRRRKA
jgi:hypothetical protein